MRIKGQSGGALIEFVVVLPLMLLLVAGIVDFGILFYNKQVITNASREGARAGIVHEKGENEEKIIISEAAISAIVEAYCADAVLINFDGTPSTSAEGTDLLYPGDLKVTVTLENYSLLLAPLLNLFGGDFDQLDVSAQTIMRME